MAQKITKNYPSLVSTGPIKDWQVFNQVIDTHQKKLEAGVGNNQLNNIFKEEAPQDRAQSKAPKLPNGVPYFQALKKANETGDSDAVKATQAVIKRWQEKVKAKPTVILKDSFEIITQDGPQKIENEVKVPALAKVGRDLTALKRDLAFNASGDMVETDIGLVKMDYAPTLDEMQTYKTPQYVFANKKIFYYNPLDKNITPIKNGVDLTDQLEAKLLQATAAAPHQVKNIPSTLITEIQKETGHKYEDFRELLKETPHQILPHIKYLKTQQIEALKAQQQEETKAIDTLCADNSYKEQVQTAFSIEPEEVASVIDDFKKGLTQKHKEQLESLTKTWEELETDLNKKLDQEGVRLAIIKDYEKKDQQSWDKGWKRVKKALGFKRPQGFMEMLKAKTVDAHMDAQGGTGVIDEKDRESIANQIKMDEVLEQLNKYAPYASMVIVNDKIEINKNQPVTIACELKKGGEDTRFDKFLENVTRGLMATQQDSAEFAFNVNMQGTPNEYREPTKAIYAAKWIIAGIRAGISLEKIQCMEGGKNWANSLDEKGKPVNGVLAEQFPAMWRYCVLLDGMSKQSRAVLNAKNQAGELQDIARAKTMHQQLNPSAVQLNQNQNAQDADVLNRQQERQEGQAQNNPQAGASGDHGPQRQPVEAVGTEGNALNQNNAQNDAVQGLRLQQNSEEVLRKQREPKKQANQTTPIVLRQNRTNNENMPANTDKNSVTLGQQSKARRVAEADLPAQGERQPAARRENPAQNAPGQDHPPITLKQMPAAELDRQQKAQIASKQRQDDLALALAKMKHPGAVALKPGAATDTKPAAESALLDKTTPAKGP